MVFPCIPQKHIFLRRDLSRVFSSRKYNFKIIIWMSQSSSGSDSFFLKTYTILVSIAGPFSPLNTLSGIMALQERNEVNNYEHYKCGEKIWTEIWRKSGALYLASSATWLHLHLCWNAITGFGVCLYQYDRYRLSYRKISFKNAVLLCLESSQVPMIWSLNTSNHSICHRFFRPWPRRA